MSEQKKTWVWETPSWVPGHIEKYLTDPEAAHLWDASSAGVDKMMPTLLLTTTGRKSGEPRHSPLLYKEFDGKYVIIGSKGGYPDHPAWYLNLQANPEAEIRVASKHMKARARVVTGDERKRYWDAMQADYAPFADYERRASAKGREIPVIAMEPLG
jgi:deazaflavin-dependent oxidoreductase (nitroreductase family)